MAIAYRSQATNGNTTTGTNPSVAGTPAVNDLWVIFCSATGSTNLTPTCSDTNTGGTYTLVFAIPKNGSADTLCCFVRDNLFGNTTATTVTVAIGAHSAAQVGLVAISGALVASSGAIRQFATQSNQAAGTTPAPVYASGSLYYALQLSVVANGTNPPNLGLTAINGPNPAWTSSINAGQTACGLQVEFGASQQGVTTVTWGSTSGSAFAAANVEVFIPAGTGVNASKLVGYALPGAGPGVNTSKELAYGLLGAGPGVNVSKLVGYAVIASTNANPPVWPNFTMPNGTVGTPYTITWDLAPALELTTYTQISGTLPPGLSLSNVGHDVGSITGTPTVAGTYNFVLRATNLLGTADKAFTIIVFNPAGIGGGALTYVG